jgi:hypothetical protein
MLKCAIPKRSLCLLILFLTAAQVHAGQAQEITMPGYIPADQEVEAAEPEPVAKPRNFYSSQIKTDTADSLVNYFIKNAADTKSINSNKSAAVKSVAPGAPNLGNTNVGCGLVSSLLAGVAATTSTMGASQNLMSFKLIGEEGGICHVQIIMHAPAITDNSLPEELKRDSVMDCSIPKDNAPIAKKVLDKLSASEKTGQMDLASPYGLDDVCRLVE